MMRVVRPRTILSTPKRLAEALGVKTYRQLRQPDWFKDFFLKYPRDALNASPSYDTVSRFAALNKRDQRRQLAAQSVAVPALFEGTSGGNSQRTRDGLPSSLELHFTSEIQPFDDELQHSSDGASVSRSNGWIIRPLRHSCGHNYRVVTDEQLHSEGYNEAQEYVQRVFPKAHEYRVIYSFGSPVVVLRKRNPLGIPSDQPWNHANGTSFTTVEDLSRCRLRHTGVIDILQSLPVVQAAHLVGADIMLTEDLRTYAVCELNFCPSLSIESNIQKVAHHVLQHYDSSESRWINPS